MDPRQRLVFALDVPGRARAMKLVAELAQDVGCFKVGLELFVSEGPQLVREIVDAGSTVFLDLKLHDIPATVGRAAAAAARLGVRFLTVHAQQRESLRAAVDAAGDGLDVLAVTMLTSIGATELASAAGGDGRTLEQIVLERALIAREAGCGGVVCSGLEAAAVRRAVDGQVSPGAGRFLVVTPGVRLAAGSDPGDDQRRVITPRAAIEAGADLVVVGRPIRDAADRRAAAREIVAEIAAARC